MSIEKYIRYNFKNKEILEEALSHPSLNSLPKKPKRDYERLELLGDTILSFVITDILIKLYPMEKEGFLSKMKSVLVSKETLFDVAQKINLGKYIIVSKAEEANDGRKKITNLSNSMEAILAAVYIDGQDLSKVYKIISDLWSSNIATLDLKQKDPKTFLQEWAHSHKHSSPKYVVLSRKGQMHIPVFEVEVNISGVTKTAKGRSIKMAEKAAAQEFISSFVNKKDE